MREGAHVSMVTAGGSGETSQQMAPCDRDSQLLGTGRRRPAAGVLPEGSLRIHAFSACEVPARQRPYGDRHGGQHGTPALPHTATCHPHGTPHTSQGVGAGRGPVQGARGGPSPRGARGCSRLPQLIPGGHPRWRIAPFPPLRILGGTWALALSLERHISSLHPSSPRPPRGSPRVTPDREECDRPRFRAPFRGAHRGFWKPPRKRRARLRGSQGPWGGPSGEAKPSTRPLNQIRSVLFLLTNAKLSWKQTWMSKKKQTRSPEGSAPVTEDVGVHTHAHAHTHTYVHVHTPCTHHVHTQWDHATECLGTSSVPT